MKFLKRYSYLGSFTTLFIITSFLLVLLSVTVFYFQKQQIDDETTLNNAQITLQVKQKVFHTDIMNTKSFLEAINKNPTFQNYIQTKHNYQATLELFLTLTATNPQIMQLRYINQKGEEEIRIDRDLPDTQPFIVQKEKLQDKSHRDYFQETQQKKKGEFYISYLDLNIEHKKIEKPYKPVLRFAIPIFKNGTKSGILIVNIFMKQILQEIVNSEHFFIYIYDNQNNNLYSNNSLINNWQKYLKAMQTTTVKKYLHNSLLFDNSPKEKLFIGIEPKSTPLSFYNILIMTLPLLLINIPMSIILAYYLSKIPKRLFDELEDQQRMLIQQSKLAAVGEMLGAIAHQWRQPLNAIGVLAQEIQLKFQYGQLTKEELDTLTQKLQTYLEYMSKTIDDFRNFFKPTKEKITFNILDAIEDALKITQEQLLHHEINVTIHQEYDVNNFSNAAEAFLLNSFEGEFKQVLINIINNAREAIESYSEEHTLEEKNIAISLRRTAEQIIIKIKDNGGGIKQEKLDDIFEVYHSTKEAQQGTGLGLYIAKLIIERNMLGKLSVNNLHDGAEFTIEFFVN